MSIIQTVYGIPELRKEASAFGTIVPTLGDIGNAAAGIGALGATYLIAGAMLTGVGIGWTGAKITAHGKLDEETAKKGYENERLKADIGYLKGKIKQEWKQSKNEDSVTPMMAMR